jgi:hypothetical protein
MAGLYATCLGLVTERKLRAETFAWQDLLCRQENPSQNLKCWKNLKNQPLEAQKQSERDKKKKKRLFSRYKEII